MDYLWLKAAHVAAVLIFIGGLFAQAIGVAAGARGGSETVRLVSRWDQRVTLPAMLAVWLTGAFVAATGAWFSNHWLWAKLVFVVALSGLHGVQSGRLRRLRGGAPVKPSASPFAVSVAIAVSVAVIAALAVAKPF
jgi:putative membrane protein